MNDYLWDGSGRPEPEIETLERTLAPLRFPLGKHPLQLPRSSRQSIPYAAIAASIVLGLVAWQLFPSNPPQLTAWTVSEDGDAAAVRKVLIGERLKTGESSRLDLESDGFGRIEIRPDSEMRFVESIAGRQRMELKHGRIHAFIWAPPQQFIVDTPSATAVDLGCQYELSVDRSGNGFLTVQTGWVAFQLGDIESFIPAGAACRTTPAGGPGSPFFEDASAAFRNALEEFERSGERKMLNHILAEARPRDGLTLWHLLARVGETERAAVFDRFAQLVPLPAGVARDNAIARDRTTLDLCWNALELDSTDWWRTWKQEWRGRR